MNSRQALLVANARYGHPSLRQLRTPVHDVDNLARTLSDPRIGHFTVLPPLVDQPEAELRRELSRFLLRARPDDTLLVYLATHGLRDVDGQLYLAAADSDPAELPWTAIAADLLCGLMRRSPAREAVLVLDCCFSGAAAAAMSGAQAVDLSQFSRGQGSGRVIITATSAEEYAWERTSGPFRPLDQADGSQFCDAFVTGLRTGRADLDGDGEISVGELYEYLRRQLARAPAGQTPGIWSYLQSTLIVAHTPVLADRPAESASPTAARPRSPWDAVRLDWRQATRAGLRETLGNGAQSQVEARGWRAAQLSDWPLATRSFAEAIGAAPTSLSAWWGHAIAQAVHAEWRAAADSFRHATELAAAEAAEFGSAHPERRLGLLELSASAALLGAACWVEVSDPRASDLVDWALRVVPACPELLALQALLRGDDISLSQALSRHPELIDDLRDADAEIFVVLREALLHAEARAEVLARARARVEQMVVTLRLPTLHSGPPTNSEAQPPELRLANFRTSAIAHREVLAAEIGRLNAVANDLARRAFDQADLDLVGIIRQAIGTANEALRYTDEPESIRARHIPPKQAPPT